MRVVRDIQVKATSGQSNVFVLVSRKQFPLVIAEAITIHKSHGQTYDKVVVDFSGRTLDLAKMYTAFSRARTADGLILVGVDAIKFPSRKESQAISVELSRLKSNPVNFECFPKCLKPVRSPSCIRISRIYRPNTRN